MLGRVQKTSRRSAERRGVGSLRRRALASKESESPRAVMHASGCRRSIRAPIGAPPAPRGNGRKKKEEAKGDANENQRNKFVARMSEATCGAVSPAGGIPDIASLIRATVRGCLTS